MAPSSVELTRLTLWEWPGGEAFILAHKAGRTTQPNAMLAQLRGSFPAFLDPDPTRPRQKGWVFTSPPYLAVARPKHQPD